MWQNLEIFAQKKKECVLFMSKGAGIENSIVLNFCNTCIISVQNFLVMNKNSHFFIYVQLSHWEMHNIYYGNWNYVFGYYIENYPVITESNKKKNKEIFFSFPKIKKE